MKKRKWKHPAPLICFIKHWILGIHSPSQMLFGTSCDYCQCPRTQCGDCRQAIDWKVLDKLPFTCPEDWENKKRIINQINKGNRSGADAHAV